MPIGYRGVVINDCLARYWTLRTARHGICAAHLLRDLTAVAEHTAQRQWASGLAGLLVEIKNARDDARARGLESLAPTLRRAFNTRYDTHGKTF